MAWVWMAFGAKDFRISRDKNGTCELNRKKVKAPGPARPLKTLVTPSKPFASLPVP